MKIKTSIISRLLLCALLFLAITKNRAMDVPRNPQDEFIFVKTTDERVVPVELWKINQMNVLRIALQDQQNEPRQNYNNKDNPINAPVNFDELTLLQNALKAASEDNFSDFFHHKWKNLRQLINAAETTQANILSALCATEAIVVPDEYQQKITKPLVKDAVNFFKNRMIARSSAERKSIGNITRVINADCSPDNRTVAAIDGKDNRVYLYDLLTGAQIRPIETNLIAWYVSFSPDGTKIAISGTNTVNNIEIHDVSTGQLLQTIPSGDGFAQFSPVDNDLLVWRSLVGECRLYNASNGSIIHDFTNIYQETIRRATFSPDGTKLLILGNNNNHRTSLWNVATGGFITNLTNKKYNNASFSPDGKQIILSSNERQPQCTLFKNIDNLSLQIDLTHRITHQYTLGFLPNAQFSPDGKSILLIVKKLNQELGTNEDLIIWNLDKDAITFDTNLPIGLEFSRKALLSRDGRWIIMATNFENEQGGLVAWNIFSKKNEQILKLFEDLNAAQARLVHELCPSETPSLEQRQGLYEKLSQSKVDFAVFKTLPKKIQSLFLKDLFVPVDTPPRSRAAEECIGQECTIL